MAKWIAGVWKYFNNWIYVRSAKQRIRIQTHNAHDFCGTAKTFRVHRKKHKKHCTISFPLFFRTFPQNHRKSSQKFIAMLRNIKKCCAESKNIEKREWRKRRRKEMFAVPIAKYCVIIATLCRWCVCVCVCVCAGMHCVIKNFSSSRSDLFLTLSRACAYNNF